VCDLRGGIVIIKMTSDLLSHITKQQSLKTHHNSSHSGPKPKPKPNLKLVIQIPAYNEQDNIASVISSIPKHIPGIHEIKILVADDGSTDNTIETAKEAGASHILSSKQNQGLGKNFKRAIDASLKLGADIIVNIDADNQFNPQDIPKLIEPILNNGADMVTATRFKKPELTKNMPFMKKLGNKLYARLISHITGHKFSDVSCGFRTYSREAALRLNLRGTFTYTQEVFIDLVEKGIKIKEVPVPVTYYKDRNSAISKNLVKYGLKSLSIIGRATRDSRPLSFFGFPGMGIFGLGFLGGLFSFIYWLIYHITTPVRTLFSISVFFMIFGLLLIVTALVADMLKTIHMTQEEILYKIKKQELEK